MLVVQKICLLCPRLFCVVLLGVLVLKDPTREIKNLSHRKTCDALANHARQRALHLFHAGASVLGDVYLTHFPFLSCCLLSDKVVFRQIFAHEFGVLITGRLSQEIVSRSVKDMSVRPECKQNALVEMRDIFISAYAVAVMCSLHKESSPS
ncbi:hypothetical protein F4604DRAFT_1825158 [Suillus subluteus]|nr:hypothetical protein F4604DRAFT_1825158 [Suillus subluteus]